MIICKEDGCIKGKKICCLLCEEKATCEAACEGDVIEPSQCENAKVSADDPVEAFKDTVSNSLSVIENIAIKKKEFDAIEKQMKEQIKDAMEKYDIKKFSSDYVDITYVAPSTRTTLDSKNLKADHPDLFEQYSKQSKVSSSIRIKVK